MPSDYKKDDLYQPNGQTRGNGQNRQNSLGSVRSAILGSRKGSIADAPATGARTFPGSPNSLEKPSVPGATSPIGAAILNGGNLDNGVSARNALGGYAPVGNMLGFNTAWDYPDEKAANSVKNTFGRIASRYAGVPNSMDLIFNDPDFQRYFAGARRVEGGAGDRIDFGSILSDFESGSPVGVVDVGASFDPTNNTGAGWAWQPLGGQQGPLDTPANTIYNQTQQSILNPAQPIPDSSNFMLQLLQQMLTENPNPQLMQLIQQGGLF